MSRKRISMNKVRKILKYSVESELSTREIESLTGISKTTVSHYISRFKSSGTAYAELEKLSDTDMKEMLKSNTEKQNPHLIQLQQLIPEYALRLRKKGMTKQFLWNEYIGKHKDGYQYTQFCYYIQIWEESQDVRMHQNHDPGDKAFLDYTGEKFPVTDPITRKEWKPEVYLAILGNSQLLYVEASESQKNEDFVRSTERALRFFEGVPKALVPDNLKSAVLKADKYEPEINPLFDDFAEHYGTAIVPARAYKPRDKALVENAVTLVYQRIFAPLYGKTFYSLDELNNAFWEQLEVHNNRKLSKLGISRRDLFEKIEKETLGQLPVESYPIKCFERHKVAPDYHFILSADKHYYSVPWQLKGQNVRVVFDDRNIAVYADNQRVVQHRRNKTPGGYTTLEQHMPRHHRFVNSWSSEKFVKWAGAIGAETLMVIEYMLKSKRHKEQAYKACIGILSQAKKHSPEDLNLACRMALNYDRVNSREIRLYLAEISSQKEQNDTDPNTLTFPIIHKNVRGKSNYQ
jgi:transposase